MRVIVTVEHHVAKAPDGSFWTPTIFQYDFWKRYLEVFDAVMVVTRVYPLSEIPASWQRVDGPQVAVYPLPDYLGAGGYLRNWLKIYKHLKLLSQSEAAFIMRVPSPLAHQLGTFLNRKRYPYGLEVVGDPEEVFTYRALRHPLASVFRWWFVTKLKMLCRRAAGVAYVTREALQRKYPPGEQTFVSYYSSVELDDQAFVQSPRAPEFFIKPSFTLVFVGNLTQLYKGQDLLIRAFARCVLQRGQNLKLVLIGGGKYRKFLERLAVQSGVKKRVQFIGQLPGSKAIRPYLDKADLFVLPSRQEGLPRAMLEAMARALPCIGSTAGGIPELLSQEDMVPVDNENALTQKICEVLADPMRLANMSRKNWSLAKQYHKQYLRKRYREFYAYIKAQTEERLRADSIQRH